MGDFDVVEHYRRHHSQPTYYYFAALVADRIEQIRRHLDSRVHLHYAIKANSYPDLVRFVGARVDGLDVASAQELSVALTTDIPPKRIGFAGPGKSHEDLESAINAGITLNVESTTELKRIAEIQAGSETQANISLRVNPDIQLKASGMKMSGGSSPFGIDSELIPNAIKQAKELGLEVRAFHIFCGSQSLSEEAIIECHSAAYELAMDLSSSLDEPLEHINLGGGLGIPYFPGEERIDPTNIVANLNKLADRFQAHSENGHLVVELGRYLVGEAGIYLCTITDKKESRGKTILVTNGGLHHHLAASGNFGQVLRKNYPVLVASHIDSAYEPIAADAVGPLCTPLDLLASNMEIGHAEIGDVVAVFQSGAYGFTASPHAFLSHPLPDQTLVESR